MLVTFFIAHFFLVTHDLNSKYKTIKYMICHNSFVRCTNKILIQIRNKRIFLVYQNKSMLERPKSSIQNICVVSKYIIYES